MALNVIRKMIPKNLREYVKLKKLKSKHKKSNCRILSADVSLLAILGQKVYIAKGVNIRDNVIIGDYSYCSEGSIIFNNTKIGKYCSIGYNTQIGCPEHPVHFISTSPNIYRNPLVEKYFDWPKDDYKDRVIIGNDVWIGSNAIILQGVEVGDGAIIAAGAVVTKNIPKYSIVGGVPARQIGIRSIETNGVPLTDWWNHDEKWIVDYIDNIYGGKS